jgi:hypothetical protein
VSKSDSGVNQSYRSNSTYQTEDLAFFKVDVEKTHIEKGMHYALISADKQQVFESVENRIQQDLLPLVDVDTSNIATVIASGVKLDIMLPRFTKYISLLKAYGQTTSFIDQPLQEFQLAYRDAKRQTSYQVIQGGLELGLKNAMTQALGLAGFNQNSTVHQLNVLIVGPERQEAEQNNLFAVKLSGNILYVLDNQLIHSTLIELFEFGQNKNQVESNILQAIGLMTGEQ